MIYKVVREGKVAVLTTVDFGAGWSTWNKDTPECLFDPETVMWIEMGRPEESMPDFEAKFGEAFYAGGVNNLVIRWLPEGTKFWILEYDGRETIQFPEDFDWITA